MINEAKSKFHPAKMDVPDKKIKLPLLDIRAAQKKKLLAMESPKPSTSTALEKGQMLDKRKPKDRKLGHRRVDDEGQITFKKIQTSQIMGSIQLGIGYAVGSLASKPERDLLMLDFTIVETTVFSRDGSSITPAHHYSDFKFKSYAPVAFRYFRDLFGIPPDDYLLSLCNYPLQELTNPGASGSIFYLTNDGEFIIKTVQHREAKFLRELLPGYYMNLKENPRTLLPKYFGLYCYICGGKNIRLAVMNNLLPPTLKFHEKYDLKGSTYKRKASKHEKTKASPTFKDLDFLEHHPDGIYLEPNTYNALTKTISRDCRVLESFKIMDYSLLVGIYNVDLARHEKLKLKHEEEEEEDDDDDNNNEEETCNEKTVDNSDSTTSSKNNEPNLKMRRKSIYRQRLAAFSTAMESIQAVFQSSDVDDDVPPGGIPARNADGDHLLLFLGIIDILQSFHFKKKLEHAWKSVLHDGDTVSVHRPSFYAQRFQDFMSKTVFKKASAIKHSPSKKKCVSSKPRPLATSETEASGNCFSKIPTEPECAQEEGSSINVTSSSHHHLAGAESTATTYDSRSNDFFSISLNTAKPRSNTDPSPSIDPIEPCAIGGTSSDTWSQTGVSLSQITLHTEPIGDHASEISSSGTSGIGSTLHPVTWTAPHSIEGSSSCNTEETPSFTDSSVSDEAAYPVTPDVDKYLDSLPPIGETSILQFSQTERS